MLNDLARDIAFAVATRDILVAGMIVTALLFAAYLVFEA